MTAKRKNAIAAMTCSGDRRGKALDVEQIWQWYWSGKAHITAPGDPILDRLAWVWNWVMSNDIARGGLLAIAVIWGALGLLDVVLGARKKGAPDDAGEMKVQEPSSANDAVEIMPPLTGKELKQELERLGKTQTDLAEALGVSRAYVSQIIKGTKPFTLEKQQRCRQILESWKQ